MLIYAHKHHRYEDVASKAVYQFQVGSVLDVKEDVGRIVIEGHPTKLCDVSSESAPAEHSCDLTERQLYENVSISEPPTTRVMTTEPQVARIHKARIKNPHAYRAKSRRDRLLDS